MSHTLGFPFLTLPRELRDHVYSYLDIPNWDHYISYHSSWCNKKRKVVSEKALSPSLRGTLSLNQACMQTYHETAQILGRIKEDLIIHFRIFNREDAALFTALASQLQRRYPTISTLRITWNISGEHTSVIEMVPIHLPNLQRVELEVIDKLNTTDFFRDANVLAWSRVNKSALYSQKRIGSLLLHSMQHITGGRITTGKYHSAYILRFEKELEC
jgi:hypothetical protein